MIDVMDKEKERKEIDTSVYNQEVCMRCWQIVNREESRKIFFKNRFWKSSITGQHHLGMTKIYCKDCTEKIHNYEGDICNSRSLFSQESMK